MIENADQYLPERPPHPGEIIQRVLLRNHQLSTADLATRTGIAQNTIDEIIAGKSDMTPDILEKLQPKFGQVAATLGRMQQTFNFYRDHGRRPTAEEKKGLVLG